MKSAKPTWVVLIAVLLFGYFLPYLYSIPGKTPGVNVPLIQVIKLPGPIEVVTICAVNLFTVAVVLFFGLRSYPLMLPFWLSAPGGYLYLAWDWGTMIYYRADAQGGLVLIRPIFGMFVAGLCGLFGVIICAVLRWLFPRPT